MDIKRNIKSMQKQLGLEKLRKYQVKAINSILDHKNTAVVAPASPKNVAIYLIPALLFKGTTLVLEPTASLLYDHVNKVRAYLTDVQHEDCTILNADYHLSDGQVYGTPHESKILFLTPDCLQDEDFLDDIRDVEISMIVVDEAHGATIEGYGFWRGHEQIDRFIDVLDQDHKKPVVVALTTTYSVSIYNRIFCYIYRDHRKWVVGSLYRPNLHFMKRSFSSDKAKLKELKRLLKEHENGSCIIYCNTREMTNDVYEEVKSWYPGDVVKCRSNIQRYFHGDKEQQFLDGERHILVATSSFGFGVNQSDVDLVIHFNLPLSLAEYYQQAGRAGLDGQKSKCILLYCEDDYQANRMILQDRINNRHHLDDALRELHRMKEYAESSEECLTSQILSALNEELDKPCGSCSNCQRLKKMK